MANKKKDTDYLYLSANLRAREAKMLTRDKMERMLDAGSFEESAKILEECGYEDMSKLTAAEVESALAAHRARVFRELAAAAPEPGLVDAFRLKYDYHNVKTLIKAEGAGVTASGERLLSESGRLSPKLIAEDYVSGEYGNMPPIMAAAVAEARSVLARTGNPQLADFILDGAQFKELLKIAGELDNPFLTGWARLSIDCANLRALVRTMRMGKDTDFLLRALISGGTVDTDRLAGVAGAGEGQAALFAASPLEEAAARGFESVTAGGSLTEFELLCDNALVRYLEKSKLKGFGQETVISFLSSLEGEITAARMILTGRLQGIAPNVIRERLREI